MASGCSSIGLRTAVGSLGVATSRWCAGCPASGPDLLLKRIVGLPGETIAVQRDRLWIDGRAADLGRPVVGSSPGRWILGPDEYFLLSDNLAIGTDSRHVGRSDALGCSDGPGLSMRQPSAVSRGGPDRVDVWRPGGSRPADSGWTIVHGRRQFDSQPRTMVPTEPVSRYTS